MDFQAHQAVDREVAHDGHHGRPFSALGGSDDTPTLGPSTMVTAIERTATLTISHASAASSMVVAVT